VQNTILFDEIVSRTKRRNKVSAKKFFIKE